MIMRLEDRLVMRKKARRFFGNDGAEMSAVSLLPYSPGRVGILRREHVAMHSLHLTDSFDIPASEAWTPQGEGQ